jgi:hypothetical protein
MDLGALCFSDGCAWFADADHALGIFLDAPGARVSESGSAGAPEAITRESSVGLKNDPPAEQ